MSQVNGVSSIISSSRRICRMVEKYGTTALESATSPEFFAAVVALNAACIAFRALDDYPYQIDSTAPYGPEDVHPGS